MPFLIYDFVSPENPIKVMPSNIGGKNGIVKNALKYSIDNNLIKPVPIVLEGSIEYTISIDSNCLLKYLKSVHKNIDTPKFLIQSDENDKRADVFSIEGIHIHSSMQTKNIKQPDGWASFMLELKLIGQPDGDSIRTKAPKIQSNLYGKVFTINYFARSWIDLELKVTGNWSPTGRYTSTFLWNTAGEFYKSKMNY